MKQSEVNKLTVEELNLKLVESKKIHGDLKVGHSVTPLENPLLIRKARRTVARLATELTKREKQ